MCASCGADGGHGDDVYNILMGLEEVALVSITKWLDIDDWASVGGRWRGGEEGVMGWVEA